MTNWLTQPSAWTDQDGNSPPACWDGSKYVVVNTHTTLTLNATVADGDTIGGTFVCQLSTGISASASTGALTDNHGNQSEDVTSTPMDISWELSAGLTDISIDVLPGFGCSSDTLTITLPDTNYNCDCDGEYPTQTLADFRGYLMVRLGMAAQLASPPPGMVALLNSFIIEAQELLYRRYKVFNLTRWYTWNMQPGVRFYDFADNADACTKKMDPRQVEWVGISQGDNCWRPLHCGINPVRFSSQSSSIPDSYEIRQCIEVWPAPADATWQLRIKGEFGLLPFAADTDVNTIDIDAIKLLSLANAKAHFGQPDAGNYMQQLTAYLGDLTAGSHHTRRYFPGDTVMLPAVRPRLAGT